MHELSLAKEILGMIEAAAQRENFGRVSELRLEAGALAGVEIAALRFALDAIMPGTCLGGAAVVIDHAAGTGWCEPCAATVVVDSRLDACPQCGSYPVRITGGTDLRVVDLVVMDEEAPQCA